MNISDHYLAVMQDLDAKHKSLKEQIETLSQQMDARYQEMESLDQFMKSLNRYANEPRHPAPEPPPEQAPLTFGPYMHMSMRWASLKLLYSRTGEALQTSTIANLLMEGGFPTSTNFNSKLSAILGQMVGKGELEREGDGWRITDAGTHRWHIIRQSDRYQNRTSSEAEESEGDGS